MKQQLCKGLNIEPTELSEPVCSNTILNHQSTQKLKRLDQVKFNDLI